MQLSGRKVLILISPVVLSLFLVGVAHAKTITTGDQESSVNINNEFNSQNTNGNTVTTGKTDIVIECNGVKKEYHSDKAENVNLNCDDETSGTAKTQVTINNKTTTSTNTITPKMNQKDDGDNDDDRYEKSGTSSANKHSFLGAKAEKREEREDLFEKITLFIRNFFKNFHF